MNACMGNRLRLNPETVDIQGWTALRSVSADVASNRYGVVSHKMNITPSDIYTSDGTRIPDLEFFLFLFFFFV